MATVCIGYVCQCDIDTFLMYFSRQVIVHQHKKHKSSELDGRGPGGHKPASVLKRGHQTAKPTSMCTGSLGVHTPTLYALYLCVDEDGDERQGDKETLLLTVEALKAQLEEQTRLCKEQVSYRSRVIGIVDT